MKKEEAVRNFVRTNYKLLTQKETFDRKRYKEMKNIYFGKQLRYRFGVPHDKEICNCLVELLIKAQRISDKGILEQTISEVPFLRMNNIRADEYGSLIDLTAKKYAMKEATQEFSEFEKQERLLEHLEREHSREIEEKIKQKKEAYRKLPSVLDDTDFDEPEELPKEEETKEWWEELNLEGNPFPGPLEGFVLIDESLYDRIIVETPPIQWALNKIKKEQPDFFHKGYLLGGELSTGKTTFFDFMAPNLAKKHVEPIRIALSENISEAHYAQKFEKEISIKIAKTANKYAIPRPSHIIDFETARLLMLEIQDKGAKGFFIFIDDLHKSSNLNRVFNFLANLQIIKNELCRDQINAVFMVSGFPSWRDKIRRESALIGFFDASDELTLPEVTPELAAQAIKKRLQAFSINPERELMVKAEFLRTIFRKTKTEIGQHAHVGFRRYIQEAVRHFEERKFDILRIDFTRLDERTTQGIKRTLEVDNDFKGSIDKLVFGGGIKKKEVRETTLKVLCEIYLRKGVSEGEDIFDKNMFSFKQLSKSGLIQKYDRRGELVWKVSPFLEELNKKVIAKFSLSMEDYLVPIYSAPTQTIRRKKIERNRVETFERDLRQWRGELEPVIVLILRTALRMYSEYIFPFAEANSEKLRSLQGMPEIAKIEECIWTMMKCIITFESPRLFEICGESNILGWKLRHRTLECSPHFISMAHNLKKHQIEETDVARLIPFANDAFGELWSEFKESMNIYRSCHVKSCEIPKRVLSTIYSEYSNILSITRPREEYFKSLSKLVGNIEEIIRQYLLVSCSLIFGPHHVRIKYYPEDIKKYITKNIPSSSTSYESYNEFENLNRGQYRFLFTQIARTSELYRFIIEPLIKNWDSQDISSFFDLFGELNIIAGHTKTISLEDRKKDVPTFFRLACRLISAISTRLRSLLIFSSTMLRSNGKIFVVFGYEYKRNRKVIRIAKVEETTDVPSAIYHHEITSVLRTNGINKIMENSDNVFGSVELDLLNIEETAIKFNTSYCKSIALIANLVAHDKVRVIPLYGTNICLEKMS